MGRVSGITQNPEMRGTENTKVRKAADERYLSVELLQHEIKNYIDGLPIHAGKQTYTYRIKKYFKRHKTGVTTAAAVLLVATRAVVDVHNPPSRLHV
ncbi:MAG: hypothetical protein MJA30_37265 [Cytophagales bacterium]|nr:hypothetical protein [Cytophagales bacterium]